MNAIELNNLSNYQNDSKEITFTEASTQIQSIVHQFLNTIELRKGKYHKSLTIEGDDGYRIDLIVNRSSQEEETLQADQVQKTTLVFSKAFDSIETVTFYILPDAKCFTMFDPRTPFQVEYQTKHDEERAEKLPKDRVTLRFPTSKKKDPEAESLKEKLIDIVKGHLDNAKTFRARVCLSVTAVFLTLSLAGLIAYFIYLQTRDQKK